MLRMTNSLFAPKTKKIILRGYQQRAQSELRTGFLKGHKRQCLALPTGGGKTVIAGSIIESALEKGTKVLFTADRLNLINQTSRALAEAGIKHGVMSGSFTHGLEKPVHVATVQTLARRGIAEDAYGLAIVDEAHLRSRYLWKWLLERDIPAIGLTATPFTEGLGRIYTNVVNVCSTNDLIRDGWLVPLKIREGVEIDMHGAPLTNKEWSARAVEERAIVLVGDMVSEWVSEVNRAFGKPVPTLVFASTVPYGEELARQFNALGYNFQHVSYKLPQEHNEKAIKDFRKGKCIGLISCEMLGRGTDFPFVRCLQDGRPYKNSIAAQIQKIGRGMRPAHKKAEEGEYVLLLDHAGNARRHQMAIQEFWEHGIKELDKGEKERARRKARKKKKKRVGYCRTCGFQVTPKDNPCPGCGTDFGSVPGDTETVAGRMVDWVPVKIKDPWKDLSQMALDRFPGDYARAQQWASGQYKGITGSWPVWKRPLKPTKKPVRGEVERLVRWNNKRYREQMRREEEKKGKKKGAA